MPQSIPIAPAQPVNSPSIPRPGPPRVLVVDDDADIRESIAQLVLLAGNGSVPEVLTAESAREALALMRDAPFDLVVSDYHLGGMDGVELLAQARLMDPQAPLILISADSDASQALASIGLVDRVTFAMKPLEPDAFSFLVEDALGTIH